MKYDEPRVDPLEDMPFTEAVSSPYIYEEQPAAVSTAAQEQSELAVCGPIDEPLPAASKPATVRLEKTKKKVATKRSWLKVDDSGEATVIVADKNKLTHKLGVQARDLRIMDPNLATTYPSAILCREKAMVVNLEYIKAIITTSCILVVNPEDEATLPFISELKLKLGQAHMASGGSYSALNDSTLKEHKSSTTALVALDMPFELRAMEVCLDSVCSYFDRLATDLEAAAYPALDALTHQVTSHNLERVRRIKSRLVRLTTRVETMREVLEKFLDDDEDMHDMNLTAKEQDAQEKLEQKMQEDAASTTSAHSRSSHSSSDSDDEEVAEVEVLLEVYFMHIDNTFNRLQTLNEYIEDTEDLVNLKLDQHRNQLISIDLFLQAFGTCTTVITCISGIFGMNLMSGFEDTPGVFNAVSIATASVAVAMFCMFIFFVWYKKLLFF